MSRTSWDWLRTTFDVYHGTNHYRLVYQNDRDGLFYYSLSVLREGQDRYIPLHHGFLEPIVCSVKSGSPLWNLEYPARPHARHHALLSQLGPFRTGLGAAVAMEKYLQYRAKSGSLIRNCRRCRKELLEMLDGLDEIVMTVPPTLITQEYSQKSLIREGV